MPESKPNSFGKGLHMDLDPRVQPKDSYRDAMNIKVVNTEGTTLSIENIKGYKQIIHLDNGNFGIANSDAEIVGYYSFPDAFVVMVVDGSVDGTDLTVPANTVTRIFMFKDTGDGIYSCVLGGLDGNNDPIPKPIYSAAMNMDVRLPVKIVGSHENNTVRRIYWTDRVTSTRTLNLEYGAYGLTAYPITTTEAPVEKISLTPSGTTNVPHLTSVIPGALPVGAYQYCFKYLTKDGGASGISPMSHLYHTTNNFGGSYKDIYGGEPGEDSDNGFTISISKLDTTYDRVVLYGIQYSSKDGVVKACKIGERATSSSQISFHHTKWENEVDISEVLEQGNTWDVCDDMAIKDNILFALNTQDRDSIIKSSEFDARLKRWNEARTASQETRYSSGGTYVRSDQESTYRYLPNQMSYSNSRNASSGSVSQNINVLGAESAGYATGSGVRASFVSRSKVSDEQKGQPQDFPFISTDDTNPDISTTLSGGGHVLSSAGAMSNKDPQRTGAFRGYQRGEIYRFGILFYDKAGNPGNVLWMGDLQMPFSHDRSAEIYDDSGVDKVRPTRIGGRVAIEDFRLDVVDGLAIPSHAHLDTAVGSNNHKSVPLFPVTNESSSGSRTFKHYTFDLMVRFDVKLSQAVKDKISGYRIVRAERSEVDRSVVQQGLYTPAIAAKARTTPYVALNANFNNSVATGSSNSTNQEAAAKALNENNITQFVMMDYLYGELDTSTSGGTQKYDSFLDKENGQASGVAERSAVFGTKTNLAYSDSGAAEQWSTLGTLGLMYSPDSIFGTIPYSFKSGDKFRSDSVLRLIDENKSTATNPYAMYGAATSEKRRFYGKKSLGGNSRDAFVGKTHTFDTQFHDLVDNDVDGWKYYCTIGAANPGLVGSAGNLAVQTYYNYKSDIEAAEELSEGGSYIKINGERLKNISYGLCKYDGTPSARIQPVNSYNDSGYTGNPTIQKGNRCIVFENDTNNRLTIPPLAGCIQRGTLAIPDEYRTHKMPYYTLGSIIRDASNMYGGVSDLSLASTRYIAAGDYITVGSASEYENIVAGGDTFVSIHSHQLTMCHYHPDHTAARWITFPVESMTNLEMRSGKHLGAGDMVGGFEPDILPNRNDFLYNDVYSQENNLKGFIALDETKPHGDLENPRQVVYSKTKVSGDYEDSWRRFPVLQFHDLDAQAGKGVALVNWRDELYTLQETGFGKLFVNSRTLIGGSEGILLGSAKTVENHKYVSTEFGCLHRDSVVSTDNGIYFVDAKNEKIVKYNGELDVLSDVKGIGKYLSDIFKPGTTLKNLDATTYSRVPNSQFTIARAGGVTAGYDPKTRRVFFTFFDTINSTSVMNTIAFNEFIDAFESKYGYYPTFWMSVNGKILTSSSARYTETAGGFKIREFDVVDNDRANFGTGHDEAYVEIVVNDGAIGNKKFDGMEIYGDTLDDGAGNLRLKDVKMSTELVPEQTITFATDAMHKLREGILRFPLRAKTATKRLIGNYAKVKITSSSSDKFSIFAIVSKIRQSFK